jgi:uncharacterized protein (TIGR02449 family)
MALSEQIDALEQRLTRLLDVMANMAAANETLRASEQALRDECQQLRDKNEQAGIRIETILNNLKQQAEQTKD